MSTSAPRAVVVARATEYDELLRRHGTRAQAEFFLKSRGQTIDGIDQAHARQRSALAAVLSAIPSRWRRSRVERGDLARFVFEPDDIVIACGQDGLVANVAKYLRGQPVIGINPDPAAYDGVLVRHASRDAGDLLADTHAGRARVEARTTVVACTDDGQRLLALNEVFVGHRSHQSARYRIQVAELEERQSSSGTIVATGTGATGWARSIHRERRAECALPSPTDARLVYFVREAFPSVRTGTTLTGGILGPSDTLAIVSELNEGGVLFGDGIEEDRITLPWGMRVVVRAAEERLALVVGR
jgi:NAD kinase